MTRGFWFHDRMETPEAPAGITVSKREKLPDGDFLLTEYCWGSVSLYFVDADEFNADERQAAYHTYLYESIPHKEPSHE